MKDENTELSKEDMDELVAVFSLLLKWDREQNPENYKMPPKSKRKQPDKCPSIMSENSQI